MGRLVTEVAQGETININGPAQVKLIECKSNGHAEKSKVSIRADKSVKIWKSRDNFED